MRGPSNERSAANLKQLKLLDWTVCVTGRLHRCSRIVLQSASSWTFPPGDVGYGSDANTSRGRQGSEFGPRCYEEAGEMRCRIVRTVRSTNVRMYVRAEVLVR